ncbi:MAG TPA: DUF5995 family protein [Gaiellaceae bacterium]
MPAVVSIAEVIFRMEAILAPLPRQDGVACFTRLYLAVTEGVQERLAKVEFNDAQFLARLDAVFAGMFFSALTAFEREPSQAPRAWMPLFEARRRRGVEPLQFAFAGMNAHINRDLPVALVTTCRELRLELEEGSPQHHDFERVNRVLAEVEAQVKRDYLGRWPRLLDRLLPRARRLDDVVAMWNIARARDAAWVNAEALWELREDARRSARYLAALDRMVGFAGRGLLVPRASLLHRFARRLRAR